MEIPVSENAENSRKMLEIALQKSEEKFRALVEQLPAITYISSIDETSTTLYVSPQVKTILGLTAAEYQADPDLWLKHIHDDDREGVLEKVHNTHTNNQPFRAEYRMISTDNQVIWFRDEAVIVNDDKGMPLYAQGVMFDITERKQAEETLLRYEYIISATGEQMSFIDRNYIYRTVNTAYLHAHRKTEQEIIGHPVSELLGADIFQQFVKKKLDRCLAGEEIHYNEWFEFPATGRRYMNVNYYPFTKDGSSGVSGVVVSSRDITASKLAEQQRRELEIQLHQKYKMEAMGVMAGGIAHDFNNNLAIILGNIELAQLKPAPDNAAAAHLANAKIAVMRSRNLVRQILTYSRQDQHEHSPTNLLPVVDETMKLLRTTIATTIAIETDIARDQVTINADPTQIQEALINLCNNAVQAMGDQGQLRIGLDYQQITQQDIPARYTAKTGYYARLTICDSGSGIPPEIVEKIFDPFFTTKQVDEGTGMGLAVVHSVIKSHGGFIRVSSQLGAGSKFELLFPLLSASGAKIALDTRLKGEERILFIDEDEMLTKLWNQILSERGYRVTTSTHSKQALELCYTNPAQFDLLITAHTMTELCGKELIAKLLHIRPDLPIILCASYSNSINAEQAKALGVKGFCMKPLESLELLQEIRRVLDE